VWLVLSIEKLLVYSYVIYSYAIIIKDITSIEYRIYQDRFSDSMKYGTKVSILNLSQQAYM